MGRVVLHIFLQIVLEMLPVSSSGHVLLLFRLLFGQESGPYLVHMHDSFGFLLHGAAVLVIAAFFYKRWLVYAYGIIRLDRSSLRLAIFCVLADAVTFFFYLLFGVTGTHFFPLWVGFLFTGLLLASLQWLPSKHVPFQKFGATDQSRYTFGSAVILGAVQGCALLPGISRFGSTFVTARWLGFCPERAFETSFMIAWPLLFAGAVKGGLKFQNFQQYTQLLQPTVLCSIVVATALSWCVLQWVARMAQQRALHRFCWWLWTSALIAFLTKRMWV